MGEHHKPNRPNNSQRNKLLPGACVFTFGFEDLGVTLVVDSPANKSASKSSKV